MKTSLAPERALVIGAGMAGLLAARVLADRFAQVTILERDDFARENGSRAGVPQGRHMHVLLASGVRVLERLFPGLQKELREAGAIPLDFGSDIKYMGPYGWLARPMGQLPAHQCSRWLLEAKVRDRVLALPNVTLEAHAAVTGLTANPTAITGARTADQHFEADLTVDASGRTSHLPAWLEQTGFDVPPETVIDALVGGATRYYSDYAGERDWGALNIQVVTWGDRRGGAVFPAENGLWQITVVGFGGDYAPTNEDAFTAFARSLRAPDIFNAISQAKPISRVWGNRSAHNRRLHVTQAKRWPDGLIAVGDSVCHLNPTYGQGMSLAALEAEALEICLAEDLSNLPRRFQRALDRITTPAWLLATGNDLRVPNCKGGPPSRAARLTNVYMDRVLKSVVHDANAARTLSEVVHMVRSPAALFSLPMVSRALVAR